LERLRETLKVKKERAILVGAVLRNHGRADGDLSELAALAETAGAIVVDRFQQKIRTVNAATYIGKGKAEMLRERVVRLKADVVIFGNDLSPGQIREIEEIVKVKVLDRSELILDIFATRAKTRQAKLQVELAQLEYTYPRLTRMWRHLDTIAGAGGGTNIGTIGGIGTRGMGEKQLEVDRRLVNKRVTELKRELANIDRRRLREIEGRGSLFKVCLVGYTNAGKTTLMNALTDADMFVEDRLFATLDTRTKKWALEGGIWVLLSDTVGFVRNLPHHLVASFKATLEEAVNADLLLHVVDVSNADAAEQAESVKTVLNEIGCGDKPALLLLNKADVLSEHKVLDTLQTMYPQAICISAKTGMDLGKVAKMVLARYNGRQLLLRITSRQGNGRLQSFLRANGIILKEQYLNGLVRIDARLGTRELARLRRLGPEELEIIEQTVS